MVLDHELVGGSPPAARCSGCSIVIRRSSNALTPMIVSATMVSSGSLCGITRTASDVGRPRSSMGWPVGGRSTSITSREPPNRVTLGRVTVVHAADRPAGMIV